MSPSRLLSPLLVIGLLVGLGTADADAAPRLTTAAHTRAKTPAPDLQATGAVVVARHPERGVPSLLATPGAVAPRFAFTPEIAARLQLAGVREHYHAAREVLDAARHLFTHDTGRGPIIVALRQTVAGVDVFHGDIKVLLDRTRRMVAVSGSPHPAALARSARPFVRAQPSAVALALADLHGQPYPAAAFIPSLEPGAAGWTRYDLSPALAPGLAFRRPARVRPVYFPAGDALLPAHFVEVQARRSGGDVEVFQYVIADDDGRVLYRRDATAYEAFKYRVWADEGGDHRPADGPLNDFTPHPTGVPGEGPTGPAPASLIAIDGFNSKGDPWLPPGATESVGNNVDAYVDHTDPDGYTPDMGEFRATITAPGVFDLTYDITQEPLATEAQSKAAIVQLFYDINWLHDWWYDSGFDEAAGNAQMDNYGRGGEGGDPLHAEAQDAALAGTRNNANMSTPSDGESPRMQMYLWSGAILEQKLEVTPPGDEYVASAASFGPPNFEIKGVFSALEDGEGTNPLDGCEPVTNDIAGTIALVDRGNCTFEVKVANAEAAGAIGVIIADHMIQDSPPSLGNDAQTEDPTIPAMGVTNATGATIRATINDGTTSGYMVRLSGVERDGTIDNMIVAHEWGHYLHHRLVECGNLACGAESEGWGDFLALHTMLRDGDDLDGVFAGTTYANFDPSGYFGIRRVPYSVDFAKNALTFRHIADNEALPDSHPILSSGPNSEVHNAGEVWATMMWEVYIALHKAHAGDMTFAERQRLMSDYIVAGMMMAPLAPTYTDQRDAILLAAGAVDQADFLTIAEAFARRGAGSCAVSPPQDSPDFIGVVEDFDLRPNGTILAAAVTDSALTCDGDGMIDGGEIGRVHVEYQNSGAKAMEAGAKVEVLAKSPSVVFPNGPSAALPALAPLEKGSADIDVAIVGALPAAEQATLTVRITTPNGCEEVRDVLLPTVLDGDLKEQASAHDDVETPKSAWTLGGQGADEIWTREVSETFGYYWLGRDLGRLTDTWIASPPLVASPTEPLVVTFEHAYAFEFSDATFWDGGVIEVSIDGGMTWEDITTYGIDPGYGGMIASDVNPINGRPAFVDQSPGYPARQKTELDFGLALAGKTALLRFRIGTDGAAGGPGWQLDNFDFSGITNTPFPVWIPDQTACAGETDGSGGESESGGATDSATGTDSATDSATSGDGGLDEGGCGCTAAPRGLAPLAAPWLAFIGLGALRRRRRVR